MIGAVVSHHMNPFRSGVARFNELLSEHLGVPFLSLLDDPWDRYERPLLSFKVSELPEPAHADVRARVADRAFDLYLHEWADTPLERELIRHGRVWCGSREIEAAVSRATDGPVATLWTPGLIRERRTIAPAELTVFCFGMAHKIQVEWFRRLRGMLEADGRSYALRVSAANHETSSLRDAQSVFEQMDDLFGNRLAFLGNLSDRAIVDELERSNFYAAFFERGVRDNNTSVASAMELGAVVITNLDDHSPTAFVHGDNILDVTRLESLPTDPLTLRRIGLRAMETARARSWDDLTEQLR